MISVVPVCSEGEGMFWPLPMIHLTSLYIASPPRSRPSRYLTSLYSPASGAGIWWLLKHVRSVQAGGTHPTGSFLIVSHLKSLSLSSDQNFDRLGGLYDEKNDVIISWRHFIQETNGQNIEHFNFFSFLFIINTQRNGKHTVSWLSFLWSLTATCYPQTVFTSPHHNEKLAGAKSLISPQINHRDRHFLRTPSRISRSTLFTSHTYFRQKDAPIYEVLGHLVNSLKLCYSSVCQGHKQIMEHNTYFLRSLVQMISTLKVSWSSQRTCIDTGSRLQRVKICQRNFSLYANL